MRTGGTWSLAVLFSLLGVSPTFGQGTVSFDATFPKEDSGAMTGTILGQGTITADPGYTALGVTLFAFCNGGGYTTIAPGTLLRGAWNITSNGLPAGSYKIFARGVFRKTIGGVDHYYFCDTASFTKAITVNTVGQTGGSCTWAVGSPSNRVAGTLQAAGACTLDLGYTLTDSFFTVHPAGGGFVFSTTSMQILGQAGFVEAPPAANGMAWPAAGNTLSISQLAVGVQLECFAYIKETKMGGDLLISAPPSTGTP